MKLIRTTGRWRAAPRPSLTKKGRDLAALEQRGGAALDAVLPAVKRIVADVRKRGDRALLRIRDAKFDGLAGRRACRRCA
jgi:histidinol dehydrogenase